MMRGHQCLHIGERSTRSPSIPRGGLNDVARWRRPVAAERANGRHVTKPQSPSLSRTRRPVLPVGAFSLAALKK
jgi:hypothetical protein